MLTCLPPCPSFKLLLQIKCLYADSPSVRRAANLSLAAVPFKPFAVSLGNALVMQAEFARQARHSKVCRRTALGGQWVVGRLDGWVGWVCG